MRQPGQSFGGILLTLAGALTGCQSNVPQALGTLEYDRITLPSPAAERIVSIDVTEGQRVAVGARLVTLENTRVEAQTRVLQADAQRQLGLGSQPA